RDRAGRVVSLLDRALARDPYHARAADLLPRHFARRADADGWLASLERRRASLALSEGFADALAALAEAIEHARSRPREPSDPTIEDVSEIAEDVNRIAEDASEIVEDVSAPLPEHGELDEDVSELVEMVSAEFVDSDDVEEILEAAELRDPATDSIRHAGP